MCDRDTVWKSIFVVFMKNGAERRILENQAPFTKTKKGVQVDLLVHTCCIYIIYEMYLQTSGQRVLLIV